MNTYMVLSIFIRVVLIRNLARDESFNSSDIFRAGIEVSYEL